MVVVGVVCPSPVVDSNRGVVVASWLVRKGVLRDLSIPVGGRAGSEPDGAAVNCRRVLPHAKAIDVPEASDGGHA